MPTPKKKTVTRKRTPTVAQRREAAQIARREPGGRSLGVTGGPARAKAKVKVTAPKTPRKTATEKSQVARREGEYASRPPPAHPYTVPPLMERARPSGRIGKTGPLLTMALGGRKSRVPTNTKWVLSSGRAGSQIPGVGWEQVSGPGLIKKRRARKTIKRRMENRGR